MQDRIFLSDFTLPCRVGITTAERRFKQNLVVCLEVYMDLRRAGRTDDLSSTIDYHALRARIKRDLSRVTYRLLEAVASKIADISLDEAPGARVTVTVSKSIYRDVRRVGVSITRSRRLKP